MSYNKSTNEVLSEIKRHAPFIDETFAIASSVRQRTKTKPVTMLEDAVLPELERALIHSEMRSIRKLFDRKSRRAQKGERYMYLAWKLRDADKKIKILKDIYTKTLPLSSKLVIQCNNEKQGQIFTLLDSLSDSERKKVKVVHDGELIDYEAGRKPDRTVKLCTQLKPYFSNDELSPEMVLSQLSTIKQNLQTSIHNTIKNRQHQRRKEAEYKHRKLNHFISVVSRLVRNVKVYGKTIKGVKSYIKLDEQRFPWPKYLIGNFEFVSPGFQTYNRSILSEHSVIVPSSGEVPIVSFDTLHIFCKDNQETIGALTLLSEHESNKFQAFSHYEISMSREYPLKNSISFPYLY